MNEFADDMASGRRILEQAAPELKLHSFTHFACEGIRWHTIRGLPKPDVVDALRTIALEAGLTEGDVQTALEAAIDRPFVPGSTRESRLDRHAGAEGKPTNHRAQLVVRRVSEIDPLPVRWLWPGRIPLGKVTLLAGEPGLGKSQLTCAVGAAVTTGSAWPFEEGRAPSGSVVILSAEDDAADTIRPRLEAAGADLARVSIISAVRSCEGGGRRSFNLQDDLKLLEIEIHRSKDVLLIIIDPVSSYLGKVDSHKNADLRAALEPLSEMAARLGVSVLAVTHLNKSGNGSANNRIIGSVAFVALARAAHIVARDREDKDRRLFVPSKSNVGPEGRALSFRTRLLEVSNGIFAPAIVWEGTVDISAEEALAPRGEKSRTAPAREAAEEFLKVVLADQPVPVRRIESEAKAAGLSWATVKRAKDALGVKASKSGLDGGWMWQLVPT